MEEMPRKMKQNDDGKRNMYQLRRLTKTLEWGNAAENKEVSVELLMAK